MNDILITAIAVILVFVVVRTVSNRFADLRDQKIEIGEIGTDSPSKEQLGRDLRLTLLAWLAVFLLAVIPGLALWHFFGPISGLAVMLAGGFAVPKHRFQD